MRALFALALLAPLPALADTFRCQTAGYCTNDLECHPDTAVFLLETDKAGNATYGWDDPGAGVFTATGANRIEGATVWHLIDPAFTQTLVLADTLQATFGLSSNIGGQLYTSFQALTCVRQ